MDIKVKIYVTLAVWLAVCAGMFLYGFKILNDSNSAALADISQQKDQQLSLQAQAESYRLEQQDLADMAKNPVQPTDFFSQDITLVRELEILENLGQKTNVTMSISPITGTINSLPKAEGTKSDLYSIPYTISASGHLGDVLNLMQTLQNLDFITPISTLSITGAQTRVNASMSATLYIRKP